MRINVALLVRAARLRAGARHLAAPARASCLRRAAEGAGAREAVRRRVGSAAARAEHLGHARAHREDRQRARCRCACRRVACATGRRGVSGERRRHERHASTQALRRLQLAQLRCALAALACCRMVAFLGAARRARCICRCSTTTSCSRKATSRYRARHRAARASRHDHRSQRRAARDVARRSSRCGRVPADVRDERRAAPPACAAARHGRAESSAASSPSTGREFVYLKRQLPPETPRERRAARIAGRRPHSANTGATTPAAKSTAHLIGFTDVDDRGQEGIELAYQDWLCRQAGQPPRDQGPPRAASSRTSTASARRRRGRDLALSHRSQAAVPRVSAS